MSNSGSVAPPRRKSCAQCIKAKRRCDLQRPRCLRCSKHNLECEYGQAHQTRQRRTTDDAGLLAFTDLDSPITIDSNNELGLEEFSPPQLATLELPGDVEDFLRTAMISPSMDKANMAIQRSTHTFMEPMTLDNLDAIIQRRLSYTLEQLKLAPRMFAEQCGTPWCHPLLYEAEMPAVTREVQASCALYALKNDNNARSIWRNIEGRAEQLFASERPTEPTALLAYTQALLLYSIMRVLGGDFAQRAKVSASLQQLEDAAYALYTTIDLSVDSATPLALYPTAESSAFWRSWIFAESQRRTFIAFFVFLSIWSLLNANLGYCAEHAAILSVWTASAHLWEADNLLDFTRSWQSKKHYVVRDFDLTEFIADATADDVDLFGKMLLSGAMGIDEFKGWLYTRGGVI